MHAGDEGAVLADRLQGGGADPGHDPHAHRDVGGVRDLDADLRHGERHDVHRPTAHRALEQAPQPGAHLAGIGPVIRRAGRFLGGGTDEGAGLDPGDVAGVGVRPVAARPALIRQRDEHALVDEELAEALVLLLGAITPLDLGGLGELRDLLDPVVQPPVPSRCHQ